jgi:hypothetical protein
MRQAIEYIGCFPHLDLGQYRAMRLRAIVAACEVAAAIGKTQILLQSLRFLLLLIIVREISLLQHGHFPCVSGILAWCATFRRLSHRYACAVRR